MVNKETQPLLNERFLTGLASRPTSRLSLARRVNEIGSVSGSGKRVGAHEALSCVVSGQMDRNQEKE